MKNFIDLYIAETIVAKGKLVKDEKIICAIEDAVSLIVSSYEKGNKLLIAGNGGSAADAQHIAGELVAKFFIDRPALSAIALTTNTSIITSIGNDFSHEEIFARQIEAYGCNGDVFLAISTSGNSKNIIKALEKAKEKGIMTIGLTGEDQCLMDSLSDVLIKVPSKKTPIIQESHITIGHLICALVEKKLFNK